MDKTTFGKTGFSVSRLGFGAAPAAYLKADRDNAATMLFTMLDRGVNLIDTASSYPGSHEFLGEHLSKRRKDFVLVSKCGGKIPEITGTPWSPDYITAQIDLALKLLRTDTIDVMLLHSCDLATLQKGEAIGALAQARDAGKIRFAGYSGDNDAAAYAAAHDDIAVIETSINIVDQHNIDTVLPVCLEHNVGVLAKRPIANAAWKDLKDQKGLYQSYAKTYTERFAKLGVKAADLGYPPESQSHWPEIALRFTLSQPGVTTAIVGTTNMSNFEFNLAYASKGPLSQSQITTLRNAFHQADPEGKWLGQT
jgi:aryl-alcohol dehydrogenase-like predicted oxidoreductase